MEHMDRYFDGFDALPLNENGFELYRNKEYLVSLYHDLTLMRFRYEGGKLMLNFIEAPDARHKASPSGRWILEAHDVVAMAIESEGEGNFEDVHGLTLLGVEEEKLRIMLEIGAMTIVFTTSKISLKEG